MVSGQPSPVRVILDHGTPHLHVVDKTAGGHVNWTSSQKHGHCHLGSKDYSRPQLWMLDQPVPNDGLREAELVDVSRVDEVSACLIEHVEQGVCVRLVTLTWPGTLCIAA